MLPKQFYKKAILHSKSQFSFKGGKASCTYCCMEAAIFLLQKLIYVDDPLLKTIIEKILKNGVYYDKQLGHRSCDEAFKSVPRFQQQLELGKIVYGTLKPGCFTTMTKHMMEFGKKDDCAIAVVLTKPPETVLVFYDPHSKNLPFVVFDSHPRIILNLSFGAGFYFFASQEACVNHVQYLFPVSSVPTGGGTLQQKVYGTFEANFVKVRSKVDFMTATIYEQTKPKFSIKEDEDRSVLSSMIATVKKKQKDDKAKKPEDEKLKIKLPEGCTEIEEPKTPTLPEGTSAENSGEKKIMLETIGTLRTQLGKVKELLKEEKAWSKSLKQMVDVLESEKKVAAENRRKNQKVIDQLRKVLESYIDDDE